MTASQTLYAWVVPAYFTDSPVDHTWITTYDNRVSPYPDINAVIAAGESNWYCWGDFHPTGGTPDNQTGFIGSQAGNVAFSSCLVQPNADSSVSPPARGTIFVYGVDGVCHQLANQVLFSTGSTSSPLTVKNARGYFASSFLYGTYGAQSAAWANKIAACSTGHALVAAAGGGTMKARGLPDDFEEHARSVLGVGDAELLNQLLALKGEVQNFTARPIPGFAPPDAAALNARNQHLLDQAAILLGPEKFKRVFGFAPGQKIDLVDEKIMRKSQNP